MLAQSPTTNVEFLAINYENTLTTGLKPNARNNWLEVIPSAPIIQEIEDIISEHPNSHIVIGIFSLCQSISTDKQRCLAKNSSENGYGFSLAIGFETLYNYLFLKYPHRKITLEKKLLADACALLYERRYIQHGETFDEMLSEYLKTRSTHQRRQAQTWVALKDDSKTLLCWLHTHYAACKFPQSNITYHIFDDSLNTIESINKCWGENPKYIPKTVAIAFHPFDAQRPLNFPVHVNIQGLQLNPTTGYDELYLRLLYQQFDDQDRLRAYLNGHLKNPELNDFDIVHFLRHLKALQTPPITATAAAAEGTPLFQRPGMVRKNRNCCSIL